MHLLRSASLCALTAVLAAAPLLIGCGDEAATGTGSDAEIRVSATNSPAAAATTVKPGSMFSSVVVTVSQIYLVPAENEEEQVPLMGATDESPVTLDLVNLGGDLPAALTETMIPADTYSQLRIVVSDATVTLADGLAFESGETVRALTVPSGDRSGIKVNILGPIEADPGSWSSLLVSFDVSQNFVIQGNPDTPAGIKDVLFKPVLNEVSRTSLPPDDSGSPEESGSSDGGTSSASSA